MLVYPVISIRKGDEILVSTLADLISRCFLDETYRLQNVATAGTWLLQARAWRCHLGGTPRVMSLVDVVGWVPKI